MKLTRKQYNAEKARIERQAAEVQTALANLQAKYDAGEIPLPISEEIGAHWNRLHDAARELEMDAYHLDREWRTRNWTSCDWQQWEMVAANID